MADFRPFPALRFNPSVAGEASALIAPPYDVVTPEQAAALRSRSPYNISRVDYGEARPADAEGDNRYTRARRDLDAWLAKGALLRDAAPRLYAYDQQFSLHGATLTRRAIFGRLRLEEWDKGIVLPHEHTRAAAKADRLDLLRATRVNLSPILAMYRGKPSRPLLGPSDLGPAVLDASLPGERHTLRPIEVAAAESVRRSLAAEKLYVADGHHRYETALFYRDEVKARAGSWTGEEPENFVLAALVDIDDPGLVVLPTHRLVKMPDAFGDPVERLQALFEVRPAGEASRPVDVEALAGAMAAAGRSMPAFGAIGLEPGKLHLVTVRDEAEVRRRIPAGHAEVWRGLDVNVLHHALFPALGNRSRPEEIEFTEDAQEAARAVLAGQWDVALLLNATRLDQLVACADAGERMPQKSTYFYPKLATGVVMYPLD